MRSTRVKLGVVVAVVCAFGALAAPAFAKIEKEPVVFGKFIASLPGGTISEGSPAKATGIGELSEAKLGPLELSEGCEKELKSVSSVTSESSNTFAAEITFKKCPVYMNWEGGSKENRVKTETSFKLDITFHSNGALVFGEEGGEFEISKATQPIKIRKNYCTGLVVIPAQVIPFRAVKNPEDEFEAASYGTEHESVSGGKLKKFPSGFQEKLDVEWELKKIKVEATETEHCQWGAQPINTETGRREWKTGTMEAELEEITISGGNIGFEPKK